MHPIIALWSHPRSMSTAMERVMRERGDLTCFHEPFMYDYYVHRKVREMPHFEAEPDRPLSYEAVRDMLMEEARTRPVFIKDMSYYVMPRIMEDRAFGNVLINAFLIRDPVASIMSYFKLDPEATLEEIGLEAHAFEWQDEKPEDWKQVEGWHGAVSASKGIRPITEDELRERAAQFDRMAEQHPRMRAYLDHHRPFYEELKVQALKP